MIIFIYFLFYFNCKILSSYISNIFRYMNLNISATRVNAVYYTLITLYNLANIFPTKVRNL